MPLAQKKLRAETRTVTKQFGDDPNDNLTVTYLIHAFNAKQQAMFGEQFLETAALLNEAKAANFQSGGHGRLTEIVGLMSGYIAKAVTAWDLLDDDGKPVELNKEAIESGVLPEILNFVFGMISEDKTGGKDSPVESPQQ